MFHSIVNTKKVIFSTNQNLFMGILATKVWNNFKSLAFYACGTEHFKGKSH